MFLSRSIGFTVAANSAEFGIQGQNKNPPLLAIRKRTMGAAKQNLRNGRVRDFGRPTTGPHYNDRDDGCDPKNRLGH